MTKFVQFAAEAYNHFKRVRDTLTAGQLWPIPLRAIAMDPESNDIEESTLQSEPEQSQSEDNYAIDRGSDHDQQHGSESATDSEPQHEENGEGDEVADPRQEALDRAVSKQHAKYREEQRKRIAAEERLQQYESGSQNNDPEPTLAEVDPYADDVDSQLRQRDESIRAHIAWQERQRNSQYQRSQYEQQTAAQQQQEAAQQAETFFSKAKEDGVDQGKLTQAIQTVGQYQLGKEVASYLMGDDRGHQVTVALAKSPSLLADLALMQPHERILHIERNVRSKVNASPRRSKGKPPATRVKGRASDASDKYPLTGGKVRVE